MIEEVFIDVLRGVWRLVFYMTLGIALGWLLEASGAVRRLGIMASPIIRLAKLPPICVSAFVTAFASAKAAGGMLSGAHSSGELDRRSLILGAVANSFPSALMHLRVSGPVMIATLGLAGGLYVAFTVMNAAIVLCVVLLLGNLTGRGDASSKQNVESVVAPPTLTPKAALRVAWNRWRKLLPKMLMVAVPLYIVVAVLNRSGCFKALASRMPAGLDAILSPSAMAVVAMQMTSTTRAVPVAREFLDSGALLPTSLFFALVTGYALSLPLRVIRRNLPSTLSLYPGRSGVWIILLSQGIRMAVAVSFIVGWIIYHRGV